MPAKPAEEVENAGAQSLTQIVRKKIEHLILRGEIAPGARLNELAIANRFAVSRSPVREAVRSLEQAGLVTVVPNRGVFVKRIALEDAVDLYDIRAGLARSAGRLIAQRITGKQLNAVEALHGEMQQAMEDGDTGTYYDMNLRFHDMLLEAAQNVRLAELDETIRNQLQLHLRRGVHGASQLRLSNLEHGHILAAIREGDSEKAGQAFEAHVLSGKQRTLENLHSLPE